MEPLIPEGTAAPMVAPAIDWTLLERGTRLRTHMNHSPITFIAHVPGVHGVQGLRGTPQPVVCLDPQNGSVLTFTAAGLFNPPLLSALDLDLRWRRAPQKDTA